MPPVGLLLLAISAVAFCCRMLALFLPSPAAAMASGGKRATARAMYTCADGSTDGRTDVLKEKHDHAGIRPYPAYFTQLSLALSSLILMTAYD